MIREISTPIDTELLPALDFHVDAMSALLRRLDALLLEVLAAAQAARETDADPLRGLYIAEQEVSRLLAPEPARAAPCPRLYAPGESPRLDRVVQRCGLSELEVD